MKIKTNSKQHSFEILTKKKNIGKALIIKRPPPYTHKHTKDAIESLISLREIGGARNQTFVCRVVDSKHV